MPFGEHHADREVAGASRTPSAPAPAPPGRRVSEEELTAIIRRAAAQGIPGWRVSAALGVPLPRAGAGT